MSKLFLTSYLAGTKNLVKEFLKDVPEKEITFVPTASNTEDYKGYVDEAKQVFLKLGFSINILDISKTKKQKIANNFFTRILLSSHLSSSIAYFSCKIRKFF